MTQEAEGNLALVLYLRLFVQIGQLVLPDPHPTEGIPLIASFHGFGSDSFVQGSCIPSLSRINRDRFALLLSNGTVGPDGNRFWNATDFCCDLHRSGVADVASLTALIEDAIPVCKWWFSPSRRQY